MSTATTQHPRTNGVDPKWFGDDFLLDPYPTHKFLRETGPIHWTDFYGGTWLIPRFSEILKALRDPNLLADRSGVPVGQLPPEEQPRFSEFNRLFKMWLLFHDGPNHLRLRKLVNHSFAPRVLRSWEPRITEIVDELLDGMEASRDEDGTVDYLNTFAYPLPARVIAEMLGIADRDQAEFIAWSTDVAIFFGTPYGSVELAERAQDGLINMTDYFRDMLPEKRQNPGDDLLSVLVRAEEEGDVLSEEEVCAQLTLFLFAGHETTRNLLGSGLLALLRNPDQLELLMNDRTIVHDAVRELLRFDSPIQFLGRTVAEDGELAGQPVKKGDSVVLLIGGGNRDPEQFTDPDTVKVTRQEGNSLAFGYGPHFCLGSPLTHLEGEIALPRIIERFPDLQIAGEPEWDPQNPGFRNLRTFNLKL